MTNEHLHSCGCCQNVGAASTVQTLQELDFERGIWSASLNGDIVKVEKFLMAGGDPNVLDSSGYTALHYAARSGHLNLCQILLDHGACTNACTRSGSVTPLQRAAYNGKIKVVQLLVERGANACQQDADGKTALHKAVEMGHAEIAKILLKANKTLVNIADCRGKVANDYIPPNSRGVWDSILHCSDSGVPISL